MSVDEVMKSNIKLTVFDTFPYDELKRVIDAVVALGYLCEFSSNGNIVFTRVTAESIASHSDDALSVGVKHHDCIDCGTYTG